MYSYWTVRQNHNFDKASIKCLYNNYPNSLRRIWQIVIIDLGENEINSIKVGSAICSDEVTYFPI